jgi:hypothetical protein
MLRSVDNKPALCAYGGRLIQLTPAQWQKLYPQLKGLTTRERSKVAQEFLIKEVKYIIPNF